MNQTIAPVVGVGTRVFVRDLRNHDEFPITIHSDIDSLDADSVTPQSVIGQALLGAQVDDIISWVTPLGPARFRITAIHPEIRP